MTSVIAVIVLLICVAGAIFVAGRKSEENKTLKQDVKAKETANEILEAQRDNRIDSVDDADRLWESRDKN